MDMFDVLHAYPNNGDSEEKTQMTKNVYCNFCGKFPKEVLLIIAGPNVYICNECVVLCMDMVNEKIEQEKEKTK